MPRSVLISLMVLWAGAGSALAQPDPSGIDFVTIGDPGNAPWTGGGATNNRGAVDYSYRIGRYEVTTAQWCEFMNAALDRPSNDHIPHVFAPAQWGAVATTPNNAGGQRFTVPAGNEMLPVGGVDWRTCAIFCNWLDHSRSADRSSFLSGSYNVSTFGYFNNGSTFTDQLTRTPGAQYYIPSLDEIMKAAHWDPNRNGPGQGGWWQYSNASDSPFVYGPPGVIRNGQLSSANAGWSDLTFPGHDPYAVPLGAYTGVTSAYGLFDVAGATSEWTEETFRLPDEMFPRGRVFYGSAWAQVTNPIEDAVSFDGGSDAPTFFGATVGFRVVAAIPSPGGALPAGVVALAALGLRRRSSFGKCR